MKACATISVPGFSCRCTSAREQVCVGAGIAHDDLHRRIGYLGATRRHIGDDNAGRIRALGYEYAVGLLNIIITNRHGIFSQKTFYTQLPALLMHRRELVSMLLLCR